MKHAIEPLNQNHQCHAFTCANNWLDDYIRKHALQNQSLGYARTYVAINADEDTIDGFYSISMGCIQFANLPAELQERVPKYPMPVCHLGCLAVAANRQRQGIGGILLIDAFRKISAAAGIIGARALEVRAIDDAAAKWYEHYGFLPFADHPNHLYLPLRTIETLLAEVGI